MPAVPLAASQSPLAIARASGSNFLTAFVFLSPGRRRALLAVYAFCRLVDDAVDLGQRGQLAFWEEELDAAFQGRPRTPLGYALSRAAARFGLDRQPLADLCRGVRMDLAPPAFATFDELRTYMSLVASAVGIACLPIFGADPARSRPYAEKLGHALQHANILRDLAEDGDRGRCYLPRDALTAHGVEASWLCSRPPAEALAPDGALAALLTAEHRRCEALFAEAAAHLPEPDRRALRPARIMASIYQDLRRRVERRGPRVLVTPRVRVPLWRKAYLATLGLR
jgi:phytoene synthase